MRRTLMAAIALFAQVTPALAYDQALCVLQNSVRFGEQSGKWVVETDSPRQGPQVIFRRTPADRNKWEMNWWGGDEKSWKTCTNTDDWDITCNDQDGTLVVKFNAVKLRYTAVYFYGWLNDVNQLTQDIVIGNCSAM